MATFISLSVGVVVYMSFWQETKSDIFDIYPDNLPLLDLAKLLLSCTMIFTFPLPFFTCRELLIIFFFPPNVATDTVEDEDETVGAARRIPEDDDDLYLSVPSPSRFHDGCTGDDILLAAPSAASAMGTCIDNDPCLDDLEQPLLTMNVSNGNISTMDDSMVTAQSHHSTASSIAASIISVATQVHGYVHNVMLLPGQDCQLKLLWHILVTFKLWFVVTGLAIAAPNLGDVLDLVGCATGTVIAFVLPSLLAMRLDGYNQKAGMILAVGGIVGIVGTFFSTRQLLRDIHVLCMQ